MPRLQHNVNRGEQSPCLLRGFVMITVIETTDNTEYSFTSTNHVDCLINCYLLNVHGAGALHSPTERTRASRQIEFTPTGVKLDRFFVQF